MKQQWRIYMNATVRETHIYTVKQETCASKKHSEKPCVRQSDHNIWICGVGYGIAYRSHYGARLNSNFVADVTFAIFYVRESFLFYSITRYLVHCFTSPNTRLEYHRLLEKPIEHLSLTLTLTLTWYTQLCVHIIVTTLWTEHIRVVLVNQWKIFSSSNICVVYDRQGCSQYWYV